MKTNRRSLIVKGCAGGLIGGTGCVRSQNRKNKVSFEVQDGDIPSFSKYIPIDYKRYDRSIELFRSKLNKFRSPPKTKTGELKKERNKPSVLEILQKNQQVYLYAAREFLNQAGLSHIDRETNDLISIDEPLILKGKYDESQIENQILNYTKGSVNYEKGETSEEISLFKPVNSTSDTLIAVGDNKIIASREQERIESIHQVASDGSFPALSKYSSLRWLLGMIGNHDIVVGSYGLEDTHGIPPGDDPLMNTLSDARGFLSGFTLTEKNVISELAAKFENLDNNTKREIRSSVGGNKNDGEVHFDNSRVLIRASYDYKYLLR